MPDAYWLLQSARRARAPAPRLRRCNAAGQLGPTRTGHEGSGPTAFAPARHQHDEAELAQGATIAHDGAAQLRAFEPPLDRPVELGSPGADDELRRPSVLEAQNLEHVHVAGERKIDARRQLALPLCQRPLERLVELEVPADTPDRTMAHEQAAGGGPQAGELGRIRRAVTLSVPASVAGIARIHDDERPVGSHRRIDGGQIGAGRRAAVLCQGWIEKSEVAGTCTFADLVIAPGRDPRRSGEQRSGRLEEIGLPGRPVVAEGAALAAAVALRAGALAIEIFADMNDEVRLARGDRFAHLRERPLRGPVAILELTGIGVIVVLLPGRLPIGLQPATGIAEHCDGADAWLRHRQWPAFDRGRYSPGREQGIADHDGEAATDLRAGAQVHRSSRIIDRDGGTLRGVRQDGTRDRAFAAENDIRGFELARMSRGGCQRQ